MFVIFLALLDVFFMIMMLLAHFDVYLSWRIAFGGAVFWIAKGLIFRGSFLSILDIFAGIYFILIMLGVHTPIVFIFTAIMIYKMMITLVFRG